MDAKDQARQVARRLSRRPSPARPPVSPETVKAQAAAISAAAAEQALTAEADRYLMGLTLWDGRPGDPDCPDCQGRGGYRLSGIPAYHSRFGKMFACDCRAAAMAAEQMARLQTVAALQPADFDLTWESITNPLIRAAVTAVRNTLAAGSGWVYLYGPVGPGKTMLLKVAVAESVRAGRPAVFVTYADLLNHLRGGFDAGDYDARIEAWRGADILAVDEFGGANDTKWVAEAQRLIFSARHERSTAGGKGVTLFSSNLSPDDHADWMADRLRDGRNKIVPVDGPSMRPLQGGGE